MSGFVINRFIINLMI